jgi:anti-anti-sigma factor
VTRSDLEVSADSVDRNALSVGMSPALSTVMETKEAPVRIEVPGELLDSASAATLIWEAASAFAQGARAIVVDLGRVRYVEPLGIAALATIQRRAPDGTRVVLASLSPYLEVVVMHTQLRDLFEVSGTAEAALEMLTPKR